MTDLRVINMDKLKHALICAIQFFIGYSCAIAAKEEASSTRGFVFSIYLFVSIYVVCYIIDKIYKYPEK